MNEILDFKNLSKRLRILIPNDLQIFNKTVFTNHNGNQLPFKTNFQDGYIFKNVVIRILIDNFIEAKQFETYWKGRMAGDLWIKNEQYLGLAKCIEPYGFIMWSLNEKEYGSIHFEYTYEEENNVPKRILLANNVINFLENLSPYEFEDRK